MFRSTSLRLRGYDYGRPGAYFLTLKSHNGSHIFGRIRDGRFYPSDIGRIVRRCWYEIPDHYPKVYLDAFVVMPHHVHGILWIADDEYDDGDLLRMTGFEPHGDDGNLIRFVDGRCGDTASRDGAGSDDVCSGGVDSDDGRSGDVRSDAARSGGVESNDVHSGGPRSGGVDSNDVHSGGSRWGGVDSNDVHSGGPRSGGPRSGGGRMVVGAVGDEGAKNFSHLHPPPHPSHPKSATPPTPSPRRSPPTSGPPVRSIDAIIPSPTSPFFGDDPRPVDLGIPDAFRRYPADLSGMTLKDEAAPFRSPSRTVGSIVRGFKIGVTKWARANTTIHHVWQRDYWDVIIRDRRHLRAVRRYIFMNPRRWRG